MMNIDIERLIDAVAACNEAYNEYCRSAKNLYKGPFETITERKNHVKRRSVSIQTPFLVLPIIRPLYASNQDSGKL